MHAPFSNLDIKLIFPQLVVALFILIAVGSGAWDKRGKSFGNAFVALIATTLAFFFVLRQWDISAVAFNEAIIGDNYSRGFDFIFLAMAGAVIMLMAEQGGAGARAGSFVFILIALLGMMLAASAGNLYVSVVSLEMTGVAASALAGIYRTSKIRARVNPFYQASVLLLIVGVVAVLHAVGTTDFFRIQNHIALGRGHHREILLGFLLMAPWFLIKAGLPIAGFRSAPSGFTALPAPIAWFVLAGPRAAAVAVIFRTLYVALPAVYPDWFGFLAAVAVALMTAGNIAALLQTGVKKIFAAAGVAQAGFALVVVASGGVYGNVSILFYIYVYILAGSGFFAMLALLEKNHEGEITLSDLAGLERKHYVFSALAALFLLSLAGAPFTAGFNGLLRVYMSAVKAKQGGLAAVMAANAVVSAFVFLRIIFVMYLYRPRTEAKPAIPGFSTAVIIALSAACVLALGFYPDFIRHALAFFKNCAIYFD
ncbi:MAG: proton-conducting transporter membrane subunit [bacterium]